MRRGWLSAFTWSGRVSAIRLERAGEAGELAGASYTLTELARELGTLGAALAPFAPAPDAGWQYGRGETIPDGWV